MVVLLWLDDYYFFSKDIKSKKKSTDGNKTVFYFYLHNKYEIQTKKIVSGEHSKR